MVANKRTMPEDASTSFAVRGNSLFGEIDDRESLEPNSIFRIYGKRPILDIEKRSTKSNYLFLVIPGKKLMTPNSLLKMGKRGGFYGWGTISKNLDVYGPYLAIEVKEPEYLDVEDDAEDDAEEIDISKVTRSWAEYWTRRQAGKLWDSFLKKYI